MNNEILASGGPADQLMFMIFTCSCFIRFPNVFPWCSCFEGVCRGGILIPNWAFKRKLDSQDKARPIRHFECSQKKQNHETSCVEISFIFHANVQNFMICSLNFQGSSTKIIENALQVCKKVDPAQAAKISVFDGVASPMQFHYFSFCFWSSPPKLLFSHWFCTSIL